MKEFQVDGNTSCGSEHGLVNQLACARRILDDLLRDWGPLGRSTERLSSIAASCGFCKAQASCLLSTRARALELSSDEKPGD